MTIRPDGNLIKIIQKICGCDVILKIGRDAPLGRLKQEHQIINKKDDGVETPRWGVSNKNIK